MKLVRYWLYRPFYWYVYAPIFDLIDAYKHRNDSPPPPVVCQICGKPGHKERYCPNAKVLVVSKFKFGHYQAVEKKEGNAV
jgi:hypothetical protein